MSYLYFIVPQGTEYVLHVALGRQVYRNVEALRRSRLKTYTDIYPAINPDTVGGSVALAYLSFKGR